MFSNSAVATSVKFSLCGLVFAIGLESGQVGIVDIETGNFIESHVCLNGDTSPIVSMRWICENEKIIDSPQREIVTERLPVWRFDGCDQFNRAGMDDVSEPGSEPPQRSNLEPFMRKSTQNEVLLSVSERGVLFARARGIYPLFSVKLGQDPLTMGSFLTSVCDNISFLHKTPRGLAMSRFLIPTNCFNHLCRESDRLCATFLGINDDISVLTECIQLMSRKWKESTRVITPKLRMLKTLLDGYQMKMNLIEFLHSVCLCGQWHPASATHFSQHWNDQGLTRLKSSVDSTTKTIQWTLQMRCIPIATNIMLRIR